MPPDVYSPELRAGRGPRALSSPHFKVVMGDLYRDFDFAFEYAASPVVLEVKGQASEAEESRLLRSFPNLSAFRSFVMASAGGSASGGAWAMKVAHLPVSWGVTSGMRDLLYGTEQHPFWFSTEFSEWVADGLNEAIGRSTRTSMIRPTSLSMAPEQTARFADDE